MEITKEIIGNFLAGTHPQERIIKIEGANDESKVHIFYRDENDRLKVEHDDFYPFLWAKHSACLNLFLDQNGQQDRNRFIAKLKEYGIKIIPLQTTNEKGEEHPRMKEGYRFMYRAERPMSYNTFLRFFEEGGVPVYARNGQQSPNSYMIVSMIEQYMIYTGKRLFKGYDDYNQLHRMQFDLETTGIDVQNDTINQIGIRTNKGYEKIITIEGEGMERLQNECKAIQDFFYIIKQENPDVISGYNSENFDWEMISSRLQHFGSSLKDFTDGIFNNKGIYKKTKQTPLKLGGETEYYYPTVMYGKNLTDGLFAVRRAQALDSNMKKTGLKYITKYSKLEKPNRVYVPGGEISDTWHITDKHFALNDKNGDWFNYTKVDFNKTLDGEWSEVKKYEFADDNTLIVRKLSESELVEEKYEIVSGKYIVERYLLDDLYETDLVELRYNQSNFLVCKMLPTSFEKCCTMGTAGIWKLIMMAWSFQHGLAIPKGEDKRNFTGGLSRLLRCGYVPNIVKLDYNSLYPSIILSYGVKTPIDISGAMLLMLEYVLTQREKYKELKAIEGSLGKEMKKKLEAGEVPMEDRERFEAEMRQHITDAALYDKMQLPLKILGNSFFGSFGADGKIFPWCDMDAAERTTCIGRQSLRLMIGVFSTPKNEVLPHFKAMLERGNKLANGEITEEEAGVHCTVENGYIKGPFESGYITQEEFDAIEDYNKYGRGFEPVVGDSFTADTPMFIKYGDNGWIDIKPISELFNKHNFRVDAYGREYDVTQKPYRVLCRSGWEYPTYVYRHNTNKSIYRVEGKNGGYVEVTQDHSLFDERQNSIKPTEITDITKLEYCNGVTENIFDAQPLVSVDTIAEMIKNGGLDAVPLWLLNTDKETTKKFVDLFDSVEGYSKTVAAGILYLKRKLNY